MSKSLADRALATRCVHAGYRPDDAHKGLVPPLVRATAFALDDEAYALRASGKSSRARIYSRENNPTVAACEGRIAALEGAARTLLFSSGMAALHALLAATLERGDRIVTSNELYGGTRVLLRRLLPKLGVADAVVDTCDLAALERALAQSEGRPRLVLVESIANPTIRVCDVPAVAARARAAGALLSVDATFASPLSQRPLEQGADVSHHSATKYLGGHSDVTAGVLSFADDALAERVWAWRTSAGGCLDADAAALLDRGLRTLHLRMRAHSDNATRLAAFLAAAPEVTAVFHPSLPSTSTHAVAQRVLAMPSGMLAFVLAGGDAQAARFARALELVIEAGTLGGVESLVSLPARMSHVHFTPEERAAMGVPPGMVRVSVGIEDADDLIADVAQALAKSAA
jgi:cystathionine beta-lyase/cystathionine gamma-synthase